MTKLGRLLRLTVLMIFVAAQTAQVLHHHSAAVDPDDCKVCQLVQTTPGVLSSGSLMPNILLSIEQLSIVEKVPVVLSTSLHAFQTRAPPAC